MAMFSGPKSKANLWYNRASSTQKYLTSLVSSRAYSTKVKYSLSAITMKKERRKERKKSKKQKSSEVLQQRRKMEKEKKRRRKEKLPLMNSK
jgi:hypothetical protein